MTSKSSNLFDIYLQSALDFAQTVVVKSEDLADALNTYVIQKTASLNAVDASNPYSWKYYQNISGHYHSTDTPMMVESLDGNGQILFSKTALLDNPITKQAYRFGSDYYNELVSVHAEQELLILGILYPCDIDVAVTAPNGKILSYAPDLIEANEVSLIDDLQKWVYEYQARWVNRAFVKNNDLFVATHIGIQTLLMVQAILNIRLRKCKTNEAHSYHVRQYLRSHGFLDFYLDELTQKQAMNFYRNIGYYVNNAGFASTFEKLVDVTMQERGLPIYAYDFYHNPSGITYVKPGETANVYPQLSFKKRGLNETALNQAQPVTNLTETLNLIENSVVGNEAYQEEYLPDIEKKLKLSRSAFARTKVVESVLTLTDSAYVNAPDAVIQNLWILLASKNIYRYSFKYTPPGTTVAIDLNQQQAVALWVYCLQQVLAPVDQTGYQFPDQVPLLHVSGVFRDVLPTIAQIEAQTDAGYLSRQDILTFLSLVPQTPTGIYSASAFQSFCGDTYLGLEAMYRLYSYKEHPKARAQGQWLYQALQCEKDVYLPSLTQSVSPYRGMSWEAFLTDIGFNQPSYSKNDYYLMLSDLYQQATGANLNSIADPANIQSAMVSLLTLLSSYSVMFAYTPAASNATPVPHPDVRTHDLELTESFSRLNRTSTLDAFTTLQTNLIDANISWSQEVGVTDATVVSHLEVRPDSVLNTKLSLGINDDLHFVRSAIDTESFSVSVGAEFDSLTPEMKQFLYESTLSS